MKIKTIIAEDEELARLRLKDLLSKFDQIEIIGEADNGDDVIQMVYSHHPDLLFLDIQMPGKNGFQVLDELKTKPEIIFTTAYDQYALQAFKQNALAYLLKPIDPEKLKIAIERVDKLLVQPEEAQSVIHDHFVSKIGSKIKFIDHEDAIYLQSKDKYTMLHANDGHTYVLDETLNFYENNLVGNFIRIHRSIIIQVSFIKFADKLGQGRINFVMKNNDELQSGSSYYSAIKEKLGI